MHLMSAIKRIPIFLLALLLCQCRCLHWCVNFLKPHSSSGSVSRFAYNIPVRPLNFEEFVQSNASRNLPPELLRKRFDVADANDDGLLTAEEITRHRMAAALNKNRIEQGS